MGQNSNIEWTTHTFNTWGPAATTERIKTKTWAQNVWIGTSIENQQQADERIPELLKIPAKVRFLSIEPLLGPVSLAQWVYFFADDLSDAFNWVIVGGESGPNARPVHPEWVRTLRDECKETGVAFFFKQWGEWLPVGVDGVNGSYSWPGNDLKLIEAHPHKFMDINGSFADCVDCKRRGFSRVGKHAAGNLLDGRQWLEMPEARQ